MTRILFWSDHMPENQRSKPAQKRDVGRWAFHRLLPPITTSFFTSRSPLCLNAFLGCVTSKGLSKLQGSRFGLQSGSLHEASMKYALRVLGSIPTFLRSWGLLSFASPWISEPVQRLPAHIPVKPIQAPL
jgi:hypothetical protein